MLAERNISLKLDTIWVVGRKCVRLGQTAPLPPLTSVLVGVELRTFPGRQPLPLSKETCRNSNRRWVTSWKCFR
jgi:hypothetical protein